MTYHHALREPQLVLHTQLACLKNRVSPQERLRGRRKRVRFKCAVQIGMGTGSLWQLATMTCKYITYILIFSSLLESKLILILLWTKDN